MRIALACLVVAVPLHASANRCDDRADTTPAPRATWTGAGNKACYGDRCATVGDRLAAEVARRARRTTSGLHSADDLDVALTIDDKLAVVSGPFPEPAAVWDVARDAPVTVKPPEHPNAQLSVAIVAGVGVVLDWDDGLASVLVAAGPVGAPFRAGLVVPLDDARAAMVGWTGSVSTIEMATGKLLRTDPVVDARVPFEADLERLGADAVLLTWTDDRDAKQTVRLHLPASGAAAVVKCEP